MGRKKLRSRSGPRKAKATVPRRPQKPKGLRFVLFVFSGFAMGALGIMVVSESAKLSSSAQTRAGSATRTTAGSGTRPPPVSGARLDPATGLYPKPPGPTPPGKVWSPQHGHWHNAPGTTQSSGTRAAPASAPPTAPPTTGSGTKAPRSAASAPAGPAPDPTTGLYPQPPGLPPPGKVWSAAHGHWHDAGPTPAPGSTAK